MTHNSQISHPNHTDFHQVILIDDNAFVIESCNSIFDVEQFMGKSICEHFCFLESEFKHISSCKSGKITFEKVQTEHSVLPGFYDFEFSKTTISDKSCIKWDIFDYTKVYEEFVKVQQLKNELDIQRQYLNRNADSRPEVNEQNFFQSEYNADYHSKTSLDLKELLNSNFDILNLVKSSSTDSRVFLDIEHLMGNLEMLSSEMQDYLTIIKKGEVEKFALRETINLLLNQKVPSLDSVPRKFTNEVPEVLKMNKRILNKVLMLLFIDESTNEFYRNTYLEVDYNSNTNLEKNFLLLNYTEKLDQPQSISQNPAMRIIKISVLQSLLNMIDGTLVANYDNEKSIFTVILSIPV